MNNDFFGEITDNRKDTKPNNRRFTFEVKLLKDGYVLVEAFYFGGSKNILLKLVKE